MDIDDQAKEIAAKATGLRPDQIALAVARYRDAAASLHEEPEWQALSHICGARESHSSYVDSKAETQVTLSINSWKVRDEWKQEKIYGVHGKTYETFGEARAAELLALAKFEPQIIK